MKARLIASFFILLPGLMVGSASIAAVTEGGEKVFRQGTLSDDYYAAGGEVTINAEVDGDVLTAGGNLSVDSRIGGDLSAAGGSVSIRGNVADDLRVAGGQIDIDATIGDDLLAAGGDIRINSATTVNGDTRIAAGDITVLGTLNGDLSVMAGNLTLGGRVLGDVEFTGEQIELLDGAVIEGDLDYRSPHDRPLNPNASINGNLRYQENEWHHERGGGFGFFLPITLAAAAILLLMLFPNYSVAAARSLADKPLNSAGLGLLFLVFTPIVAFLLMVIVVGVWVGLTLLVLYLVALLAGYLIGCIFIGDWGGGLLKQDLSGRTRRLLSVVLAIICAGVAWHGARTRRFAEFHRPLDRPRCGVTAVAQ